jgi:hypothetical protein
MLLALDNSRSIPTNARLSSVWLVILSSMLRVNGELNGGQITPFHEGSSYGKEEDS